MIDILTELSTSSGSSQVTSHTAVKTSSQMGQDGTGDNLSHADALVFVSGSPETQNVDGVKPAPGQSIYPEKDESPEMPKQTVNASAVSDKNNGTEGVQLKTDHNSSSVAVKDNMEIDISTNCINENDDKCDKIKQVTNKPTHTQMKSVHRKLFGNLNSDAKHKGTST